MDTIDTIVKGTYATPDPTRWPGGYLQIDVELRGFLGDPALFNHEFARYRLGAADYLSKIDEGRGGLNSHELDGCEKVIFGCMKAKGLLKSPVYKRFRPPVTALMAVQRPARETRPTASEPQVLELPPLPEPAQAMTLELEDLVTVPEAVKRTGVPARKIYPWAKEHHRLLLHQRAMYVSVQAVLAAFKAP